MSLVSKLQHLSEWHALIYRKNSRISANKRHPLAVRMNNHPPILSSNFLCVNRQWMSKHHRENAGAFAIPLSRVESFTQMSCNSSCNITEKTAQLVVYNRFIYISYFILFCTNELGWRYIQNTMDGDVEVDKGCSCCLDGTHARVWDCGSSKSHDTWNSKTRSRRMNPNQKKSVLSLSL